MATEKPSPQIQTVFIDVTESEYWRLFCICIPSCILPSPKYMRVKNKMAEAGWTYEKTLPGYLKGTVSLKFWRQLNN
jgi:hypothetical protein